LFTAKTKVQISISRAVLEEVSRFNIERDMSRFVEQALVYYIAALKCREQSRRDVEIINANIERFNKEAVENLEFQTIL
jgi:hypothetical protein